MAFTSRRGTAFTSQCGSELTPGFTVLELVVALAMLTVVVLSVVQVTVYTARAVSVARGLTMGSVLAGDKLEQLRGLAWTYDASGTPIGDVQTDVTVDPERPTGGTGLRRSPSDALSRNVAGYCDFLDAHGRSLGGGTQPPRGSGDFVSCEIGRAHV